jgi:hypothetical protein
MTRRTVEVAGALRVLSQPLIVELKEFKVRMLLAAMTRRVERQGRDLPPAVKGTLNPLLGCHITRTKNATLESALE